MKKETDAKTALQHEVFRLRNRIKNATDYLELIERDREKTKSEKILIGTTLQYLRP